MGHHIPAGFFLLRTPALPWDVIQRWCDGLEATHALSQGGELDAALAQDTMVLRMRLREIVKRPDVRSALYVASPGLHARLESWLEGVETEAALGVEPAIVRYVMRMAGRATPFGLFAGCTLGIEAGQTRLSVPDVAAHKRHTRLNLDWIFALAFRLSQKQEFREHLRYRTNSTLYRVGARLRYHSVRLETGTPKNARTYPLCDVAASPHAEVAIAVGRRAGGATIGEMADAIVAAFDGVKRDEAVDYVTGLVNAQIFWSSLLPAVTGQEALSRLIEELRTIPAATKTADALQTVLDEVAALDYGGPGKLALSERLTEKVRAISEGIDLASLLKVDLRKPAAGITLSRTVLRGNRGRGGAHFRTRVGERAEDGHVRPRVRRTISGARSAPARGPRCGGRNRFRAPPRRRHLSPHQRAHAEALRYL